MEQLSAFIFRHIVHAGHLQALGAAIIVHFAAQMNGVASSMPLILWAYFLFLPIYLHDRHHDVHATPEADADRTAHMRLYASILPALIGILIAVVMGTLLWREMYLGVLVSGVVYVGGLLYPAYCKPITRYVPLFKNVYVAAFFGLLCLLPLLFVGTWYVSSALVGFMLFVFLETLAMQFALDIKDRESDMRQRLMTLPVLVGERGTYGGILLMSLGAIVVASIFSFPLTGRLLLCAAIGVNVVAMWRIARGDARGFVIMAAKFVFWLPIAVV